MSKKRVVITGFGTVNPCGNNNDEYWESLINGKSGINLIDTFDTSEFPTKFAGTVKDFNGETYMYRKELKRASRFIVLGYSAAVQALEHSGLDVKSFAEHVGVEIGSGIGGIDILEKMSITLNQRGPSKVSPFTVPMMIIDMISGFISIKTGAKGPNA